MDFKVIITKPFYLAFLFLLSCTLTEQETEILAKPKVDKRVELMSIVFRLADSQEYSSNRFPSYVDNIEKHFNEYKNHELISYIKEELRNNGVGYDAVMAMAISITENYPFKPIVQFTEEIPEKRWGKEPATKFLILLNEFYVTADCASFFENNQSLYKTASQNFIKVFEELDVSWYKRFYGESPKGEFRIINGLSNGGGNYGPKISIDNKEIIYAIMGTWSVDSLGTPLYEVNDYFPTLLHEFNHSFVNHIVEKYHNELAYSGEIIFEPLRNQMDAQAYASWQTMYAEAVVRAAVIKYLKDHNYPTDFIAKELEREIKSGFYWTKELVSELEKYSQNRDKYPNLESFMPEIVKFFNKVSEKVKEDDADEKIVKN